MSTQIRLGFALMLTLMLVAGGLSVYNAHKLNEAAANLEGRYSTLYKLFTNPSSDVDSEAGFGKEMVEQAVTIVGEQVKSNYTFLLVIVGAALLFGGMITVLFPWKITRPVERLVKATQTVKKGDYSYRITGLEGTGEISKLAGSFNDMLRNIEDTHKSNLELLDQTKRFNETLREKIEEATRAIREQQNELIRAERLAIIGEFATRIAHEIKNPLSGITVALEIMRGKARDEEQEHSITEVLKEVRRLDGILRELLQLSVPKEMDLREIDPNEVVERSIVLVRPRAEKKGVSMTVKHGASAPCRLDYEKCQQVLINLLINAIDSTEPGRGTVSVETKSVNGSLQITIQDDGSGIPESEIEKIFEPFYSSKKQGTGLGLPISKKIIESHSGEIT
ncbi:MAG: HAMP domain-containing protein, partial [Candidatus Dadabacteria bacterium]|nr:HAMP domain-containing protein [Candidatus Dadabacteria bacterium]